MKTLSQYINEQSNREKWLSCVKKMYGWYCDNFENFYDAKHQYKDDNYKECELIDNKKVMADCSGFVGACLCLAGYDDEPLKWNVRLGSFNHYNNSNDDDLNKFDKKYITKIHHMSDISEFECHRLSDEKKEKQDLSEIKAGDIIVKGSHVTIAADDGAEHLYDWGKQIMTQGETVYKNAFPVDFYVPKDKNMTYPYRSYWRLK